MKRTSTFLACTAALVLAACTSDSQLPSPTGKGGVRGINAIPGSPVVTFRIEERSLGNLNYKNSSTPTLYDDFEYNFNFDIINPGEDEAQCWFAKPGFGGGGTRSIFSSLALRESAQRLSA